MELYRKKQQELQETENDKILNPMKMIMRFSGFDWRSSTGVTSSSSGSCVYSESIGGGTFGIVSDDGSLGTTTVSTGNETIGWWFIPDVSGDYEVELSSSKEQYGTIEHNGHHMVLEGDDGTLSYSEIARHNEVVAYGYSQATGSANTVVHMNAGTTYRFRLKEEYLNHSITIDHHATTATVKLIRNG